MYTLHNELILEKEVGANINFYLFIFLNKEIITQHILSLSQS